MRKLHVVLGMPTVVSLVEPEELPYLQRGRAQKALTKDLTVAVFWETGSREFVVPAGFISDGASTPRFLWWAFPPSYAPAARAAIVHDYLYAREPAMFDKAFADAVFYDIMLQDGARPIV